MSGTAATGGSSSRSSPAMPQVSLPASTAALNEIPLELAEIVMRYLSRTNDLLHLRHTCRVYRSWTTPRTVIVFGSGTEATPSSYDRRWSEDAPRAVVHTGIAKLC
jgi:hypothetical protein